MVLKKRKNISSQKGKANSLIKSIFIGSGVGIVIWALLLVGASSVISGFDEPENFVTVTAFALIALCSFISGMIAVKLSGVRNILPGFASGGILLLIVWALSLALSRSDGAMSLPLKLIIVFNFLFFALLGALAGRPSGKVKRRSAR